MTPCPRCNRHVREESCPFCGEKCVHSATTTLGRVARSALFAAATAALSDCSTVVFYGSPCLVDGSCNTPTSDAASDVASVPFYGGSCPGNFCPDASDASDDAADSDSD